MKQHNLFTQCQILALMLWALVSHSQERMTVSDYEQALEYTHGNLMNKKVFNLHTDVNWFEDNSGVWFTEFDTHGKTYRQVLFSEGKKELLFDHEALAGSLSEMLGKEISPKHLPLNNIEKSGDTIQFLLGKKSFRWDTATAILTETKEQARSWRREDNRTRSKSPDGKWITFVKDHNLIIQNTSSGEEYPLTSDGEPGYDYASHYGWFDKMEGENGDRPEHFSVQWSPDSKWIATQVVDTRKAEKMYLLDYSIDSLFKPKLLSYYRGSPGDSTVVKVKPVFFDVDQKRQLEIDLPSKIHVGAVSWRFMDEPHKILASYQTRGFKKQLVKEIDLKQESVTTLLEETSETSIDNFDYRYLPEWDALLILSERSGWKQLQLFDLKSKTLKPLTTGEFVINQIASIDKENKMVYYLASGVDEDQNPYHQKLYKVSLRGKITTLTPEEGHHSIHFSKDNKYFTDAISTVRKPTKTVLREASTGKIITTLTEANVDHVSREGWEAPETFSLNGKDGVTQIYGALWKPTHFDPNKKYPVIDATYTGPHTQVFPKSFDLAFSHQAMAELGFVVVAVDGLGTAGRSKAFREVSYMNMGDNLRDHVNAILHLGKKYDWIDTEKVGIFGHSAGGYDAAHGILAFPEFYKVAVASSGDHDFRMEKAWWPEMYMGWPVDQRYEEVSNISLAENLRGKLLLVHGSLDDNVNPSATFKLAEALVRADRPFDLLIIPSQRHGYSGEYGNYFNKKRWNYFIEHLLGKEPLWDYNFK